MTNVNLFTFRVDEKRLRAHVRDLRNHYVQGNEAVRRANEQSVAWLGARAAQNLGGKEGKIKRARDFRNPIPLAEIVADPRASFASADGFQFLIHQRIQALSARAARYYRAIEYGSDYWVGKDVALIFYGPGGRGRQAAWGRTAGARGRNGRVLPVVRITNPVPAHLYADAAIESFTLGHVAGFYINRELRSEGLLA